MKNDLRFIWDAVSDDEFDRAAAIGISVESLHTMISKHVNQLENQAKLDEVMLVILIAFKNICESRGHELRDSNRIMKEEVRK